MKNIYMKYCLLYEILFKNNMLYAETIDFILYHIFNTQNVYTCLFVSFTRV